MDEKAKLALESTDTDINSVSTATTMSAGAATPSNNLSQYNEEFRKTIEVSSLGRQVLTIQLFKPEGRSLGFSVVGLRSDNKGELGIYVQEIQVS